MPSIMTRADYETVTIARCRAIMKRAGMATTPYPADPANPNPDLNDPLATALDEFGIQPADRMAVSDADVSRIGPTLQPRVLDLVEIRTLESCIQGIVTLPRSIQFEDYKKDTSVSVKDIQDLIDVKWRRYQDRWSRSGVPLIAPMNPSVARPLDPSGYFPSV